MSVSTRIKVMLVDDSLTLRARLRKALENDPGIEVVAEAGDPFAAREAFIALTPDVMVVDVVMPGMDGLTFLGKVMEYRPTAVVLFTSRITAEMASAAYSAGAAAVLEKPSGEGASRFATRAMELIGVIKRIAPAYTSPSSSLLPVVIPSAHLVERIIAIGASTGGPDAVARLITLLPAEIPPLLISVHMPAGFTAAFANRLGQLGKLRVSEARDGMNLKPGMAVVAPGNRHLVLRGTPGHWHAGVDSGPPLRHHRPSVDILFHSVASLAGHRALGVLLTGMGDDGAEGLMQLHGQGCTTIAQDEASSVVFGMPNEAIRRGAVTTVLPLDDIPASITRWVRAPLPRRTTHASVDL